MALDVAVKPYTFKKIALFSDIHFGRKANSIEHNQDCIDFVDWFCSQVEADSDIEAIGFLGDWNENRSALNIQTMNFSYMAAKRLNTLNLPIFFVVGNHDLYHRHTRDVHSIVPFNEFSNFEVIDEPIVVKNDHGDILFCPYLFHEEYSQLAQFIDIPTWMGHFEFKGFEVTGYGVKMPTGPDPADFKGPKFILSGHFHKRQAHDDTNVVYIGNAFPADFGDAGDNGRGMAVYDVVKNDLVFYDWPDCPKYTKTKLSDLLDNTVTLFDRSRVKCIVDIPVTFEESTFLRQKFTEKHNLREFTLEESIDIKAALSETEVEVDWDTTKLASVDELVREMLKGIESDHISNEKLITIYSTLESKKQ